MYKLHIVKLLFAGFIALTFNSCGPDEKVETPKTIDPIVALPFNAQNPPITVPSPLNTSKDQKAKEIVDILRSTNAITSYENYFIVPSNAVVSNSPVEGSAMQNSSPTVYTWTFNNGSQFVNAAYQISESEGNYNFEIFFDYGDGLDKFLEGKESVNSLKNGFLLDYGLSGSSQVQLNYQWSESTQEGFFISLVNANKKIDISIGNDGSGKVEVLINNVPNADYTWDSAGTGGTYIYYNSNGMVLQSGSWAG